jgi:type IV fimbrial biogenesis protein FimT
MLITGRHSAFDQSGFTLIELMITITIVSILTLFAMPSYKTWIANSRVRTTTEAIQNGLMLAKGQALAKNAKVQLVLTSSSPDVANVNTVTASTAGSGWMVRVYQTTSFTSADFIQGRSVAEGGVNTTVAAGQSTFVFTGVGGLSPIPAADIAINVSGTGSDRPLRIEVSQGGAIRMCDPSASLTTSAMRC